MRVGILPLTAAIGVSFLAGSAVTNAWTQSSSAQAPAATVVSFMRTEPGGQEAYEQLERELWMPVHEERIRSGEMAGWEFYRVSFPGGTSQEYTYVTVDHYDSLEDSQGGIEAVRPFFERVHPDMTPDEVGEQTGGARETVRTELWTRLESLP